MSAKHLRLIILTLAVVLLLWGASERFSRASDTITGGFSLPAPAPADVDTISFIKGQDSIVLAKQSATTWTVNRHRAAPDAVNELFQALHDSAPPELVAQDSSSFGRLNVDNATGRRLRLRGAGKPLLDVIIGARGSEYGSAYVRRPGDSHVYLWRGRLGSLADRTAEEWRDKRIAALAPDSVTLVEVERGKDRYALRRAGKAWTLDRAAADSGAVARLPRSTPPARCGRRGASRCAVPAAHSSRSCSTRSRARSGCAAPRAPLRAASRVCCTG